MRPCGIGENPWTERANNSTRRVKLFKKSLVLDALCAVPKIDILMIFSPLWTDIECNDTKTNGGNNSWDAVWWSCLFSSLWKTVEMSDDSLKRCENGATDSEFDQVESPSFKRWKMTFNRRKLLAPSGRMWTNFFRKECKHCGHYVVRCDLRGNCEKDIDFFIEIITDIRTARPAKFKFFPETCSRFSSEISVVFFLFESRRMPSKRVIALKKKEFCGSAEHSDRISGKMSRCGGQKKKLKFECFRPV